MEIDGFSRRPKTDLIEISDEDEAEREAYEATKKRNRKNITVKTKQRYLGAKIVSNDVIRQQYRPIQLSAQNGVDISTSNVGFNDGYSEVCASSLSTHMLEVLRMRSASIRTFNRYSTLYLEAICPFCESEKTFTTQYWIQHIRSHTGEYSNECGKCGELVRFSTHCGRTTIQSEEIDLRQNDLKANVCSVCNFVQIDLEKVHTHFRNQHKNSIEDFGNRYEEVILLPSCISQPAQSKSK